MTGMQNRTNLRDAKKKMLYALKQSESTLP